LDALETDVDRAAFVALLHARVRASYPRQSDGRVLFPFRRTFVIAYA
jgi:trans-aconitate 2-methyltransferase